MQTNRMSWFDNNEPIAVPYYSEGENICLNKIVFTHEDNQYIPKKGSVTLYTCTWKNYVSLRNTLTHVFSGFVTLINDFPVILQRININNPAFCELIESPEHELFVIPAHRGSEDRICTEGGVRLVTSRFLTKGNLATRTVNIYAGEDMGYTGAYLVDCYFEKPDAPKDPVNLYFV